MENKKVIENELKDLGINLPVCLKSPNDVPVGYFDNFSDSVLELVKEEDFLASLPKNMPFELEKTYFSTLENDIKSKIFVDSLPKEMPFEIETGYFSTLENELLTKINEDDFIASLPKEMPFVVPAGYFSTLEKEIAQKVEFPKKEITPLRVHRRKYQSMSIAASILLILGIGFLLLKPTSTINVEQQLSKISTSEINAYIQQHQAEFATDIVTETIDASSVDINLLENEIIQSQINNLSEEDLKNYL